ncbi:MAG: aminoacyl-tRNA hydrolase [Gemmatimonadota bacterium]|nr:aminoacyl-tRNA hydrolase [Gemmatimonadota bacterium]
MSEVAPQAADDGLRINERVVIPRTELVTRATRAGGPGGQHVNTASTRIELFWDVVATRGLDEAARTRVLKRLASRVDGAGVLRVVASASRSQRRNRDAAEERLAELVRRALEVPKPRKRTRPTRAAKEARLADKRRRAETKRSRREEPE